MVLHSHVVCYRAYEPNKNAASRIIAEANRLLSHVPGLHAFHTSRIRNVGRVVEGQAPGVMLNIIFKSTTDYDDYMKNPKHLEFAKFMLHGYMLEGSVAEDLEQEFIDHVLAGKERRTWVRNSAVPDDEVVWDGEVTTDAF